MGLAYHTFLAVVVAVSIFAVSVWSVKPVLLTIDNFDSETATSSYVFVKFFAPWCGHCKQMAPDWRKLESAYLVHRGNALVASVDCTSTDGSPLCSKYNVRGYPTLKFFSRADFESSWKETPFEGRDRMYDAMAAFMENNSGLKPVLPEYPSFAVELTPNSLETALKAKRNVFVLFTPDAVQGVPLSTEVLAFDRISNIYNDNSLAWFAKAPVSKVGALVEKYGVKALLDAKKYAFVHIWGDSNPKENRVFVFEGAITPDELAILAGKFIGRERDPDGDFGNKVGLDDVLSDLAKDYIRSYERDLLKTIAREYIANELTADSRDKSGRLVSAQLYLTVMEDVDQDLTYPKRKLAMIDQALVTEWDARKERDAGILLKNVLDTFV